MSRRTRIPLLIVGSIVLVFVTWELLEQAFQPHYAGRTVSQWFRQYYRSSEAEQPDVYEFERANRALQRMGTNAVPFLLEQAFATKKDSALTTNFYRLFGIFPKSWHLPKYIPSIMAQERAMAVLVSLKAPAAPVMPRVQGCLNSTNEDQHLKVHWLLASLGEGREMAVPYLTQEIMSTNQTLRISALGALCSLGPSSQKALPTLIKILKSEEDAWSDYLWALKTIGAIGNNAMPVLPELRSEFLNTTNVEARYYLASTIAKVDPRLVEAIDFLSKAFHEGTDKALRLEALNALGEIGTNAPQVQEALFAALDDLDAEIFDEGLYWIDRNEMSIRPYLPRLKMQLSCDDQRRRLNVASVILAEEPDHEAALRVMTEFVRAPSVLQESAISLLCDRRPDSKETVDLLNQVSKGAGPGVQAVIRDAFKRMEIKRRLEKEMP